MATWKQMPDEPTIDELTDSDDQPATRRQVAGVERQVAELRDAVKAAGENLAPLKEDVAALKSDVTGLRNDLAAKPLRSDLAALEQRLDRKMEAMKNEILHNFEALVENIEDSLKGANADEISLLQNKQGDHEQRIATLENRTSLR